MAKTGRDSVQQMLRLPEGLRERVKQSADANGRSMNAEIVEALEERYPAPSPFYRRMPNSDLEIGVARWSQKDGSWVPMDWDLWSAFRQQGQLDAGRDGSTQGKQYFVVLVLDEDDTLANIIPHMFVLDKQGRIIADAFDETSQERIAEYNRIFLLPSHTPSDTAFLKSVEDEVLPHRYPPVAAHSKLRDFILEHTGERGVDAALSRAGFISA